MSAAVLGPCRELDLLAEGGMAQVRQGETDDGIAVAIKRIRTEFVFDADFKRLFADEGALCAQLEHDNLVRLLDSGEDDCGPYLVFEYVDGTDLGVVLNARMAQERPLELGQTFAIAIPMMSALGYAHGCQNADGESLGIVHRDVSPGNILLGENGDVKLADFGVAFSKLKTDATVAGEMKGKFAYMSPEQTRGDPVTAACDIFAAGIVLYECLTGRRCYDGPTDADVVAMVREHQVVRPDEINPDVPRELADLVMQMLQKAPAERPASADAVRETLTTICEDYCLDQGQRRHIGRLVREHPRAPTSEQQRGPRRSTQRVLGAESVMAVRPARQSRVPRVTIAAAILIIGVLALAWATRDDASPGSGATPTDGIVATQLPPSAPDVPPNADISAHAPDTPPNDSATRAPATSTTLTPAATTTRKKARTRKSATTTATTAKTRGLKRRVVRAVSPAVPAAKKVTKGTPVDRPVRIAKATVPASTSPQPAGAGPQGFGLVNISSEPWAEVYIDGAKYGVTPLAKRKLPAGRHQVRLKNPHYNLEETFTIEVKQDQTVTTFKDLAKRP